MLDVLRESGLVLDVIQLAERLSVMPSEAEQAVEKLVGSGQVRESPGPFGKCYAVPQVTRRRAR
ncbi:hypothetical protein L083_7768 [Actinoplanes sp. N902-109]|nr:hypothetical protein L083_7768 [Actinoplanes sp. N902-109]